MEATDPLTAIDPWWVEDWCRSYQRRAGQDTLLRWCIGQYQLAQMHKAHTHGDLEGERTSAAAFMLHTVSAVCLYAPVTPHLRRDWRMNGVEWFEEHQLFVTMLGMTQQLVYLATTRPGMARYARVDKAKLATDAAACISMVLGCVPPSQRAWAIETEMERLDAYEWRSR